MEAFPDAKVVLTQRNTSSWYKSVQSTLREHARLKENWVIRAMVLMTGKGKMLTLIDKKQQRFPGKQKSVLEE